MVVQAVRKAKQSLRDWSCREASLPETFLRKSCSAELIAEILELGKGLGTWEKEPSAQNQCIDPGTRGSLACCRVYRKASVGTMRCNGGRVCLTLMVGISSLQEDTYKRNMDL